MRFSLRPLLRLPLIIFMILVLSSFLACGAVIYSTLAAHLRGEHLRLDTGYLEVEFPKDWFAANWEEKNESVGNSCVTIFFPPGSAAVMSFKVHDEVSTQTFMSENDLSDAFSVVMFDVNGMYNWSLENNNNATLVFIENGTTLVSGYKADYAKISIVDGIKENEAFHNLTCVFISCETQQKLIQIAFWGKEEDWNQTWDAFQIVLDSAKM